MSFFNCVKCLIYRCILILEGLKLYFTHCCLQINNSGYSLCVCKIIYVNKKYIKIKKKIFFYLLFSLQLWDIRNSSIVHEYKGHFESCLCAKFVPSHLTGGRNLLMTSSNDCTVRVWDRDSRGKMGFLSAS